MNNTETTATIWTRIDMGLIVWQSSEIAMKSLFNTASISPTDGRQPLLLFRDPIFCSSYYTFELPFSFGKWFSVKPSFPSVSLMLC